MTQDVGQPELDDIGWRILDDLQSDGRISYSELGRRVGLSAPAVAERVKRMEELGILIGIHARANPDQLGWPVAAFVKLRCRFEFCARLEALAAEKPEILECHHVTGEDSFMLRVQVPSISALEKVINRLRRYGDTDTSIILSSPVRAKPVRGGRPDHTKAAE